MTPLPGLRGAWWLALPRTAANELEHHAPVVTRHPCGRPWVLGAPGPVTTAGAGAVRAVAIGELLAQEGEFAAALRAAAACGDFDALMGFPGSYTVLVSAPGRMLLYCDAAGLRPLYTARCAHGVVAGDRARLLAALAGAGLDEVWAAGRLCAPDVPSAIRTTRSPYRGVAPVPAGCRAVLGAEEPRARIARYWHPPAPVLPLEEGARRVRAALAEAVAGRARRSRDPVCVALSGGMDSAALAALAAEAVGPGRLRLVTLPSAASGDLPWAHKVAAHLGAPLEVLDDAPDLFAGLPGVLPTTDEPPPAAGAARIARLARAAGSGPHLNGQGGDEVVGVPLAHLRHLVRAPRRGFLRHLRGHAALHNTTSAALLRHASAPASPSRWARTAAAHLDTAPDALGAAMDWEAHPRLASWATLRARRLVAAALTHAPLNPWADLATHAALARIRTSAAAAATYRQAMAGIGGPEPAFPFFDRPVVEACLAVRPEARSDPWRAKPLLAAALRPLLPDPVLERSTKASYTTDVHQGWARHRSHLLGLLSEPHLAQAGLVNADRLHGALERWGAAGPAPAYVTGLVGLELWARSVLGEAVAC
ncbi:asparagine synthase-related protein [Streptomonospora nanhaiensis]|uniref:asparagine synthase-related protein n=1 Tax=Streptomonospora nanhaiensis TaxID=1323731 RepID=UPI001C9A2049|nr:asparagine synthase-related protein [Streptomonospora nanhaiensis]MBX9387318.1 hypothetical protein [Streptomonospora nanhaiensis]